jgi:hypothetical protein
MMRWARIPVLLTLVSLPAAPGFRAAGQAPSCDAWAVEGYRIGMTKEEARALRPTPALGATSRGGSDQSSRGVTKRFSRTWRIPVRDTASEWRGRLSFKNDRLIRASVRLRSADLGSLVEATRRRLATPTPEQGPHVFESYRCNSRITIERHGKAGAEITLETRYPLDTGKAEKSVPVFEPDYPEDRPLPPR